MTYGYARVSTVDQNEARQLVALRAAGVETILVDKASGKDFLRPQYQKLRRRLKKGDLLVVQSLDRFGRCYDDVIEEWRYLVKSVGVDVRILDMPLLDTRQGDGLIGRFVGDVVLQVLSFVAETERTKIRERQAQGIAAAKARGVTFGRPRVARPDNMAELLRLYASGKLTLREAALEARVTKSTFYRTARAAGIRRTPVRRERPSRRLEKPHATRKPNVEQKTSGACGRPSVEWVMALPAKDRWQYARHWTPAERRRAQEIERGRW